jgi:hypothetical protein
VSENLELVKAAINGDKEAINSLIDISSEKILIESGINIEEGAGQEINDWIGS